MKKLLLVGALVVLMGQGCSFNTRTQGNVNTNVVPPPPAGKCPDVCAAICSGQPEPEVPQGCPMPMCACDPQPTLEVETKTELKIETGGTQKPTPAPKPAPAPTPTPTPTPAPAPQPQTVNVTISNFAFGSGSVTVNKGDKIVFKNNDQMTHTVTSGSGKFNGSVSAGQTFTLDTSTLAAGTYPYHCTPHPFMTGTIIVK